MADTRAYNSPRRQRQAEHTRSEILGAARRLFSDRGYAATPITEIAADAGVSVPTLYASVGSKAAIALALVEFIDDEVDMATLAAPQFEATTGLGVLRANANLCRVLNEQCGDIMRALLSAAAADSEVAPAAAQGRQIHRDGCRMVVERLDSLEVLSHDLTVEQATAILTTTTAPEAVEQLVAEHGWTYDDVENWLIRALPRLLLDPAAHPG